MDSRILPLLGLLGLLSFQSASARTWINSTGQPIKGSFLELRNGSVRIRLDDDRKAVNVPLKILSKADQEFVRKRTMTGKADLVALAVKRIDAAVDAGLEKQKLKYNENLN
ncbi:MAG: SHD1 domain-containing protein, partial [Roseibacillus sp.]|nr:SHD1 domain-containing protein [Roseibacillus sp.]